jgi:hypothetical protein
MDRPTLPVGTRFEVVAAAVASIVLTVLAVTKAILTVHADQSQWDATAARPPAADDDSTRENGGGTGWV